VGKELSFDMKLSHLNIAEPSSGNKKIILNTKVFFENYPERKKDTFALIQLSYGGRLDYVCRTNNEHLEMRTVNIVRDHKSIDEFFKDADVVEWTALNFYSAISEIQDYLKQNRIPYLIYNGMQSVVTRPKRYLSNIIKTIDKENFFHLDNQDFVHYKWCEDRNFLIPKDLHPTLDGVKKYSKLLLEKIQH
jgi:hypothetical protein